MADYNGDITQFSQPLHRAAADNRIVVAVVLLLVLGFTGAHRFYLGEIRHGMFHLTLCFVAVFFGLLTLNVWLALSIWGIQAMILILELFFFFIRAAMSG